MDRLPTVARERLREAAGPGLRVRDRRYGEASKKFRTMVSARFITKTPKQIRSYYRRGYDATWVNRMRPLRKALEALLPAGKVNDLGVKYTKIGLNFFRNDYLRDVIAVQPAYNDLLRVFSGDNDYRTNKIAEVAFNHQRQLELDLNNVFAKQVDKAVFYKAAKK